MIICFEKNSNGSYTFHGCMKNTYYGYTFAQCKALQRKAIRDSGYTGSITFVRL